MIDKDILILLQKKLNLKERQTRNRIEKIRKEIGYGYSSEIAAYVLAYENDIDPSPFIKVEELTEYRGAIQTRQTMKQPLIHKTPVPTYEEKTGQRKTSRSQKPIVVQFNELEKYEVTNLPKTIVNEATEMAQIYPLIYLYENSVREFIKEILDERNPDWWDNVNKGIKERAERRQKTEIQNAYHGKSRVHLIQYLDFDDLRNIIQSNALIFNEYMPDKNIEYMQQKLRELKDSRNILMHCNPLTEDDKNRVRLYLSDWVRLLKTMLSAPKG